MTNGEYFVLTHPDVTVKENGTCVWIYNLDNTACNYYTMSTEWWNEEMVDIRPKGKWGDVFHHQGFNYHKCSNCHIAMKVSDYDNYCPNCGADMR